LSAVDLIVATVASAAGLFAGTNIDDIVVLAALNVSRRAGGRPRAWQIWVGPATGIAVLVVVSLLAALGLRLIPEGWIWLLGLVPIGLGVWRLVIAVRAHAAGTPVSAAMAAGLPGVIGRTIANGGDNIAAYTPVFRTLSPAATAMTIAVFAVAVPVWCLAGSWLVSHQRITVTIQRWGHWIIPAVFITIGLYVFYKAGVLGL
jgi:cadmium resistance protein CadD (predicted permease)